MEKVHIAASPIGFLAFDDKGELVHLKLMEKGKINKDMAIPSDFVKELNQGAVEDEKSKIFASAFEGNSHFFWFCFRRRRIQRVYV